MSAVEPVTPHSGVNVGANTRWRLVRLGVCFAEVDRRVGAGKPGVLLSVSQIKGVVRRDIITDKPPSASDFSKYKQCAAGDLVLNRFNAYRGSLGVSTEAGIVSPDYLVLRPTDANADFVEYLLRSSLVSSLMKQSMGGIGASDPDSSGFSRIDTRQLFRFVLPLPTHDEQTQIATYLNFETAEIDAFIADQEELIGLLAERRAATISHAVTKGLDPTVPMKDSGVEWLGGIPEHWTCTRMSRFFDVTLGKMLDAGKAVSEDALVLPYVRAANIQEAGLDLTSVNQMPFTRSEARSFDIRQGDLLVVEGGAVGVNAYMDQDLSGWSFQKTVNRVRPTSVGVNSKFLGYALDALRWAGVIEMISNKSTIAHLTAEKLERLVLAFPAREEQDAIASFLDNETAELNAAIADANETIALSRERRAALISAAVTGKIDVREHGAVA